MELVCVGVSHKSAPLTVRERLAISDAHLDPLLGQLAHEPFEALAVRTCNRVELYVMGPTAEAAGGVAREALAAMAGEPLERHLYEHRGDPALVHLFRVASSLDSMVVGEAQILGQMKEAFEHARTAGFARGMLSKVCFAAFGCAKRVRTETEIGRSAVSMASAAVSLAGKIFGKLSGRCVLVVGAGEMGELTAKHLKSAGARRLLVANRTQARAEALAASLDGEAWPFERLDKALTAADVVVCSTASPEPIFTRKSVAGILESRKHRPLFMVDLAVPRDIAPDVHTLDGVYAYDVDDIHRVVEEGSAARLAEAGRAEVIVAEEVARFSRARAVREGVPVLALLRKRAEAIARAELAKTLPGLESALSDKQKKSLEAMAMAIVNKLLHEPTARLREVGESDAHLAVAVAELFGLEAARGPRPAGAGAVRSEPRPLTKTGTEQ